MREMKSMEEIRKHKLDWYVQELIDSCKILAPFVRYSNGDRWITDKESSDILYGLYFDKEKKIFLPQSPMYEMKAKAIQIKYQENTNFIGLTTA